ncbi:MAG: glycosyltransferase [Methanomicrobiaceae archaeon]|nr:glycosyltransferase [Methanomicrobiaceae archaeon]
MADFNEIEGQNGGKTIVVVPCYNESENIPKIVRLISDMKNRGGLAGIDFVFVNDGSRDNSLELIKQLSAEHGWMKYADHGVNKGFAQALRTGRQYAIDNSYDLIGQIDCDMTHPLEMLVEMQKLFPEYDMVLASRYVKGGGMKNVPLWRVLLSETAQVFFRTVFRIKTRDATSGYRLIKKEVLQNVPLEEDTFAIQLELTIKAERAGYTICELPFVLVNREFGSSSFNMKQFIVYVKSVMRLIF